MKTITIEEHFSIPAPHGGTPDRRASSAAGPMAGYMAEIGKKLGDLGAGRLADMDKAGIDMQVLSLSAVAEGVGAADAAAYFHDANDALAEAIRREPQRYAGLATLALTDPEGAASELERCITKHGLVGAVVDGTSEGRFLDDPRFEPVLAAAAKLEVPIYIHPAPPPATVTEAYYRGLPGEFSHLLSISGFGWHAEMGVHSLRLILAGVFDRFPKLQIIIGHMGEFIPYCLARTDTVFRRATSHLERSVSEYFRTNFHITTSGYFTVPPLLCAVSVVGVERILFAVDYPYSPNEAGRKFLDSIPLGQSDIERIAHGNAERLLKLPA